MCAYVRKRTTSGSDLTCQHFKLLFSPVYAIPFFHFPFQMGTDVINLNSDKNFITELHLLLHSVYSYECFIAVFIPIINVNKKII